MSKQTLTSSMGRPSVSAGAVRRRALFEEAVAVIEQTYDQASLVGLAQAIFTSERQLQRAFAEAGTSFQETLQTIRMERSAELLVESSLPVSVIARLVGYQSAAQFAKAFRRRYQLAPTQVRSINSGSAADEVIPGNCKCGCQTPDQPLGARQPARSNRDAHQREVERRLQDLDRRLLEVDKAA